jgi:hypothetical protein
VALPTLSRQKDSANKQKGASQVTAEEWLPIPDSFYEISSRGNVRTVNHVVVRSNGYRYRVQGRLRRITVDRRDGRRYVKLATGRRGQYRTLYIHRLMEDVFGETTPANIDPPPANSSKLDSTMQPSQQTPANSNGWSP